LYATPGYAALATAIAGQSSVAQAIAGTRQDGAIDG